jgi:hypothetical protein
MLICCLEYGWSVHQYTFRLERKVTVMWVKSEHREDYVALGYSMGLTTILVIDTLLASP